MTAPTNHWKLGLFVVVGLLLAMTVVVYFGARTLQKQTVTYTSYVDEAVTGLEVGAPVRFRGVTIGNVSGVDIAPDRRHVQLTYDLAVDVLQRLGLAAERGAQTKIHMPPDLRAQLGSQGITGVKYILIDYFDERSNPAPVLPFPVPENYIPATASSLKNIESAVVRAVDQFPAVSERLTQVLDQLERMLAELNQSGLSKNAATALAHADRVLGTLDRKLAQVDARGLSAEARATLANMNTTLRQVHGLLARVDGDRGLLASVQRASDSLGDVAGDAQGFGTELGETLRELADAASAVRQVLHALERDSDMLLKGRSKAHRP